MDILTRDPSEYMALLNARRFAKLKKQIRYCFSNVDYYRQRFLEAGVDSPEAIDSLDDFRRLPAFLDKARHRESQQRSLDRYGHPYGLHLTVPLDRVIHVAATAGTTGHPTFYVFTKKDLDITATILSRSFRAAGITPGDTVLHAFRLSLWLAGLTFIQALETYGARPIAVGAEGGIPKILRYIELTRPKALFATPSLVSHLIERAPEEIGKPVGDLGIRIVFCGGEPGPGFRRSESASARATAPRCSISPGAPGTTPRSPATAPTTTACITWRKTTASATTSSIRKQGLP